MTSNPNYVDRKRLLRRFLEYVQIDTTANTDSDTYPSSPGQWTLGRLILSQLHEQGIADAEQDEHGLVWATIPSNIDGLCPTVLFNSHFDTSPEAPGNNVRPRVINAYPGGDIHLEHNNAKITPENSPELEGLHGKTLIVTDGRTLLGGDDKAGLATIMELVSCLIEHPEIPHGPIRILFTCDEEIGCGTQKIELKKVAAHVGYTLDGGGIGDIDEETFSADMALIRFIGKNIHPSIAKNRMANAVRAAGLFVSQLPSNQLTPETTDHRDGFLHPYDLQGGVGEATLQLILRDFDTAKLADYKQLLVDLAKKVELQIPGLRIEMETRRQYRNMADGLKKLPLAVELAERAYAKLGIPSRRSIIRGGTDGAMLTEMGLPMPNLSVGQFNIHSVLEFACLDHMHSAADVLIELVQLWGQQRA
ncbi:MAG: peptidase T [Pirellulaceae bacterium]|nr:peptidase T [Pirellulaceae bacterium]